MSALTGKLHSQACSYPTASSLPELQVEIAATCDSLKNSITSSVLLGFVIFVFCYGLLGPSMTQRVSIKPAVCAVGSPQMRPWHVAAVQRATCWDLNYRLQPPTVNNRGRRFLRVTLNICPYTAFTPTGLVVNVQGQSLGFRCWIQDNRPFLMDSDRILRHCSALLIECTPEASKNERTDRRVNCLIAMHWHKCAYTLSLAMHRESDTWIGIKVLCKRHELLSLNFARALSIRLYIGWPRRSSTNGCVNR